MMKYDKAVQDACNTLRRGFSYVTLRLQYQFLHTRFSVNAVISRYATSYSNGLRLILVVINVENVDARTHCTKEEKYQLISKDAR
jgi:hypothetical protein